MKSARYPRPFAVRVAAFVCGSEGVIGGIALVLAFSLFAMMGLQTLAAWQAGLFDSPRSMPPGAVLEQSFPAAPLDERVSGARS